MMLRKAANLMSGRVIGSLPVMDDGQLVGIVTATDVLDALGSGSTRPQRRPEPRALRMTESRRRAAQKPAVARRVSGSRTGRARNRKPDSSEQSPFPGWIPKTAKRQPAVEGSQIAAHIRAREGDLGPDDRAYIRRKLGRTLGKFSDSIERVSVRTEDVNGPRGGVDRVCRIKVVLSGMPSIVFESRDAALHAAVDGALTGVERSVRRAIQRRRMKPIRRAA